MISEECLDGFIYRHHVQEDNFSCATGKLVSYLAQIYSRCQADTHTTLVVLQEFRIDGLLER